MADLRLFYTSDTNVPTPPTGSASIFIDPSGTWTAKYSDGSTGGVGGIGPIGPVGPTGPTGPQGIQGPIGPSGVQGPIGPQGDPTIVNGLSGSSITLTTNNISESGNLYFTTLRAVNACSGVYAPISSIVTVPNMIRVAQLATNGFTSIHDAINSIGDAGPTKPYVVFVEPGIYVEPQINIPSYVSIIGRSINEVVVEPDGAHDLFTMSAMTEVAFLTVRNVTSPYYAFDTANCGDFAQLHKVSIYEANGIKLNSVIGNDDRVYLEYVDINGPYDNAVVLTCVSGASAFINAENFYCFQNASAAGTKDVDVSGPGAEINIKTAGFEGNSSGTAIYINNEAICELSNADITTYDNGIYVDDAGVGPVVEFQSFNVQNSTSYDLYIKHASAQGIVNGIYKRTQTYDNPLNTQISWFQQSTGKKMTLGGDLYLGQNFNVAQYMSPLISNSPTMGVINGGALTAGSGLNLNVAAGFGYVDTDEADWTKTKYIEWTGQSILLDASSDNYIYFNSNGILVADPTQVNGDVDKILLGRVVTTASVIDFIEHAPQNASHLGNKLEEVFRDAFGPIVADGIQSTIASGMKFDITGGEYYWGATSYDVDPMTTPAFVEFYKVSGNQTARYNSSGVVDGARYNDLVTVSGLTALTGGYFTKHGLWLTAEVAAPLLVYGQNEYADVTSCELGPTPTPPSSFKDTVIHISDIIVCQGSGSIVSMVDTRAVVGFKQSLASTSIGNNHSTLLNLSADDHTQYLLINGNRAMLGDLYLGGNNIINVGTIDGVDITAHASQHLPNGTDPLATAVPTDITVGSAGAGSANSFSHSDHAHGYTYPTPTQIGAQPSGSYLVSGTTTTSIPEGTNQYFTNAKVLTAISGQIIDPMAIVLGFGGYIDLDITSADPSWSEGRVFYNNTDKSLCYYNDNSNVTVNVGQENLIRVYNTGPDIYDGQPVHVMGAYGNRPTVHLSCADAFDNQRVIGLATHNIPSGTQGYVTAQGVIHWVDPTPIGLSGVAAGTQLYLSPTVSGNLTATRPSAPNFVVPVGVVTRSIFGTVDILVDIQPPAILGWDGANTLLGINASADGQEYKAISGVGTVDVHHSANLISVSGIPYTASLPISVTGQNITIASGSASTNGYISSGDWTTFNNKQNAIGYIPVSGVNGKSGLSITLTTSDITEGTNLYYTDARARAVVSGTAPIVVSNGLVSLDMSRAECWFSGNATATTFTQNVPKVISGTTTAGELLNFTHTSPTRLTYTGAISGNFFVTASFDYTGANNNTNFNFYIAKNGSVIGKSKRATRIVTANTVPVAAQSQCITPLVSGNYIELWAENITSSNAATITDMNISIIQA